MVSRTDQEPAQVRPLSGPTDRCVLRRRHRPPANDAESKAILKQLGDKPTAEKWQVALKDLTATAEFLIHVNSLIQRVNGKNRRGLDPLQPNFGDP